MPDIGADVPSSQSWADNALSIAEDLKGVGTDFENAYTSADGILKGSPEVNGMNEFGEEYESFIKTVQNEAVVISDNIYSSASEIGNTDTENSENLRYNPDGTPIPNF